MPGPVVLSDTPGGVSQSYEGPSDRQPKLPRWAFPHLTNQEYAAMSNSTPQPQVPGPTGSGGQPPVYDPTEQVKDGPIFFDIASRNFVDQDGRLVASKIQVLDDPDYWRLIIGHRLRRRKESEVFPDIRKGVAHLLGHENPDTELNLSSARQGNRALPEQGSMEPMGKKAELHHRDPHVDPIRYNEQNPDLKSSLTDPKSKEPEDPGF